jgi:hypothetical protein
MSMQLQVRVAASFGDLVAEQHQPVFTTAKQSLPSAQGTWLSAKNTRQKFCQVLHCTQQTPLGEG